MDIHPKHQTVWRRFWAILIDSFILLFAIVTATEGLSRTSFLNFFSHELRLQFIVTFLYVTPVVYSILLHSARGQTIGKQIVGVKVLRLSEEKLGFLRAVLRDLPWAIFTTLGLLLFFSLCVTGDGLQANTDCLRLKFWSEAIGYSLVAMSIAPIIFNSKRRSLPDFIAGSVVVRTAGMISTRTDRRPLADPFI